MADFDPTEFGKAMGEIVREAVAPLLERIDALEAALSALPAPPKVSDLIAHEGLRALVDMEVAAYMAENPPEKGEKGADGDGIADLLIDREGALVATYTDGRLKTVGVVVGKDGEPGKDGADFSKAELDWEGERTLVIRGAGGEIRKTLPVPLDAGYWREGMACEKGDIVTHDGSAWIALIPTKAKPSHDAKAEWRLFARKGRDGRDGQDGKPPPGPVSLKKPEDGDGA